ncbi:MAG: hypothetical protein MSG64_12080 [Pyrinomonadaceae bacterium MAG19_C2-C3]|nr:hypothetical protein [Pyrinomonadaceae bacterium MAG19_C2-C3]
MAQVRAITKIKATPKTAGRFSTLALYMAERKLDHECEGSESRLLFNQTRDDLSHREAEETLTSNRGLSLKEDIKHIIVALAKKDY